MHKVLIKTKSWIDEFAQKEIKKYCKKELEVISPGFYKILFDNEDNLFEGVSNLIFYSRTLENIYLEFAHFGALNDFKLIDIDFKKELSFEVDASGIEEKNTLEKEIGSKISEKFSDLKVDLSHPELSFKVLKENDLYFLGLDLAGFKLSKRDYKLNINSNSINSLVPNYCFYLCGLDEQKKYSIIDPASSLGDVIIEASLFNPRKALNIKLRYNFPLTKIFNKLSPIPKAESDDNKYIAVVQNNKIFKHLKENINYSSQKIKISQYDFDWLDVKLKESEVDYVITIFPSFKEDLEFREFQKEFFYQAEFISAKKIAVISKKEISKLILRKYRLKIIIEKKIEVGEQVYHIYIIG